MACIECCTGLTGVIVVREYIEHRYPMSRRPAEWRWYRLTSSGLTLWPSTSTVNLYIHGYWRRGVVVSGVRCAIRKFDYLLNYGTFFWNFVPNSGLNNNVCVLKLYKNCSSKMHHFTARCYVSAVLCPSVRLCLSQVGVLSKGWTNRAGFWHVSFLPPVLHCVKRKFGYLQK